MSIYASNNKEWANSPHGSCFKAYSDYPSLVFDAYMGFKYQCTNWGKDFLE